jgi:hypothetical protein
MIEYAVSPPSPQRNHASVFVTDTNGVLHFFHVDPGVGWQDDATRFNTGFKQG